MADIQKISREVRGQAVEEIQVQYIQAGKRPGQIGLGLKLADEAIDIVRQWVGPWQHIYADPTMITAEQSNETGISRLNDLVASIADHLVLSFSEPESLSLHKRLLEPVRFIAMSGLELTVEAGRP